MISLEQTLEALKDLKAEDIVHFDISKLSDFADHMIIASGTSTQHVRAIANHLRSEAKALNTDILGTEGDDTAEWILVDLGDSVVNIMLPQTREYYQLEKLWDMPEED